MVKSYNDAILKIIEMHYESILYIDFDVDSFYSIKSDGLTADIPHIKKASELFSYYINTKASTDFDKARLSAAGDAKVLRQMFKDNDNQPISMDFQSKSNGNLENLFNIEIVPDQDVSNGHLCAYLFISNETKKREDSYSLIKDSIEMVSNYAKENKKLLDKTSRRLELIHETIQSGMWEMEFDEVEKLSAVKWSHEFRKLLGYTNEEDFPDTLEAWINTIHPKDVQNVLSEYWDTVFDYTGNKTYDVKYRAKTKSGEYRWFHAAGKLARDESGKPLDFVGIFVDITERKMLEDENVTDEMTDLYNRKEYDHDIMKIVENKDTSYSIVILDVNGLKRTNDDLGHEAGDELIKASADCIKDVYSTLGKCYRIGGDEFAVLIKASSLALDNLKTNLNNATSLYKGEAIDEVSLSVGYASNEDYPGAPISTLIKIADKFMYMDKEMYYKTTGKDRRKN